MVKTLCDKINAMFEAENKMEEICEDINYQETLLEALQLKLEQERRDILISSIGDDGEYISKDWGVISTLERKINEVKSEIISLKSNRGFQDKTTIKCRIDVHRSLYKVTPHLDYVEMNSE